MMPNGVVSGCANLRLTRAPEIRSDPTRCIEEQGLHVSARQSYFFPLILFYYPSTPSHPKTGNKCFKQVLLECFGSPFMRSINVVVALLFGYFVAAVSNNNGNDYVVSTKIDAGVCCVCVKTS